MPTVDVRITSMYQPSEVGSIRGYASATIDSCLAIRESPARRPGFVITHGY